MVVGGIASCAAVPVEMKLAAAQVLHKDRFAFLDDRARKLRVSAGAPSTLLMQRVRGQAIGGCLQVLEKDRLVAGRVLFSLDGSRTGERQQTSRQENRQPVFGMANAFVIFGSRLNEC